LRTSSSDRRLHRRLVELGTIGGLEFFPALRVAVEEPAQSIAGGDFLPPKIDPCPFLRQAAWPKAINQNTNAVCILRRFVNPF
jgi:hypothetical protein